MYDRSYSNTFSFINSIQYNETQAKTGDIRGTSTAKPLSRVRLELSKTSMVKKTVLPFQDNKKSIFKLSAQSNPSCYKKR